MRGNRYIRKQAWTPSSDWRSTNSAATSTLARISHQLSAAAGNLQQSAAFAPVGVLHVLSSTRPRPSGRKHHISQQLPALATKAGEICRLGCLLFLPTTTGNGRDLGSVPGLTRVQCESGENASFSSFVRRRVGQRFFGLRRAGEGLLPIPVDSRRHHCVCRQGRPLERLDRGRRRAEVDHAPGLESFFELPLVVSDNNRD